MSRKVLKVMALFTGMQFFNIFCSIVRTKLVALWLGADGVGLTGILTSTMETTSTLTDLGLRQSAVRDVAANANRPSSLARIAVVVRRWSWFTGLLGAVVISGLCVPLSDWFFGTAERWWMFAILSLAMILNALAGGEQALLQGAQRLKPLLRAGAWGAAVGLLLSVPLYRWCGLTGVLWSVVLYAATGLAATLVYRLRTHSQTPPTVAETWCEGAGFMRLGAWMALAAFITNLAHMAFIAFLSEEASLAEVGYYQGGITLTVRYLGLIFTAMGMEYYPRLAANAFSPRRTQIFVNHEARVLLTVLVPVIALFLLFRRPVVLLLYQAEFEAMIPFISWGVLSSVPKATSWSMAFVMPARGDGRMYILTESVDALVGLGLCIAGYRLWGLAGVGIAYIGWYTVYALMVWSVYRFRYGLRLSGAVIWLTLISFILGLLGLAAMTWLPYWASCLLLGGAALSSYPFLRNLWRKRTPSPQP